MSGLGLAVICVAFILNEETAEKDTNDLLYTEPDNPDFEDQKKKKKEKSPTSVRFPPLRRFYFDEMERFHQIPRMFDIYIYMYIVQYEDFWLKFLLHKRYKIIFQCQRSAALTSSMF